MKTCARWKPPAILGVKRLLLVLLGLGVHLSAQAQEGQAIPRQYLSKGSLHIPIQIDERARPQIQEVHLYVKEGPRAPWKLKEKVPGTQTFFTFPAGPEGEYWLNLVIVDRAGRAVPADITNEPARLIVIVDRTPPHAEVQVLSTNLDGTRVRCDIHDAHADPSGTHFFYQRRDLEWRPLAPVSGQPEVFCIPFEERLTGMIRVVARDLAGNAMTRELNLAVMPMANNTTAPTAPPLAVNDNAVGKIDMLPPLPVANTTGPDGPVIVSEKVIPFSERIELVANKPRPVPLPQVSSVDEVMSISPSTFPGSRVPFVPDAVSWPSCRPRCPKIVTSSAIPVCFLIIRSSKPGAAA